MAVASRTPPQGSPGARRARSKSSCTEFSTKAFMRPARSTTDLVNAIAVNVQNGGPQSSAVSRASRLPATARTNAVRSLARLRAFDTPPSTRFGPARTYLVQRPSGVLLIPSPHELFVLHHRKPAFGSGIAVEAQR
jgi:hypothetical protein